MTSGHLACRIALPVTLMIGTVLLSVVGCARVHRKITYTVVGDLSSAEGEDLIALLRDDGYLDADQVMVMRRLSPTEVGVLTSAGYVRIEIKEDQTKELHFSRMMPSIHMVEVTADGKVLPAREASEQRTYEVTSWEWVMKSRQE